MQRIFNLDKWRTILEGEFIEFLSDRPRTVRLEVNARDRVRLFVQQEGGEPAFLAIVEGRDTVEFSANGAFDLYVEGGECAVYTADGDDWSVAEVDAVTFTKIVERRIRNPELELMMAITRQNMETRLAAQSAEMERRFEATLARRDAASAVTLPAAAGNVDQGTGAAPSGATGGDPAPVDGAGASVPSPAPAPAPAGS